MHSCEDMFLMCIWKGKQVNCTDVFVIHKTDNGFCCSFNALKASEMFKMAEDINSGMTKDDITQFYDDYSDDEDNVDYFWSSSESFYGCGGVLTEDIGSISSPKTNDLLQCEWIIRAPAGMRINLNFQQFGLNNYIEYKCLDYVSVYDGGSTMFPLLGRYCGHISPPSHISTGNQILIRYKSINSLSNIGFIASYQMSAFDDKTISFENQSIPEGEMMRQKNLFQIVSQH